MIGGQYWDSIILACGLDAYVRQTGDATLLGECLPAVANTLADRERDEFSPELGLFRGGACFQDGISAYPDIYADTVRPDSGVETWAPRDPAVRAPRGHGFPAHALSTNCLYVAAYRILTARAAAAGMVVDPAWAAKAEALTQAIRRHFRRDGGWRYLVDRWGGSDAQEGLGWAFAILFGVADADDAAYATFVTDRGVICQFNSSWCVRVRRDDLLTLQVDGTRGSAVAGLRDCRVQHAANTPKPVWNPDIDSPIDFRAGWVPVPANRIYENAFKAQWELFLRHVVLDEPFRWSLKEGAKGVQLAELAIESWKRRAWIDVPEM